MRNSFAPSRSQLLVDWEHGNVLRADDRVIITTRHAGVHPFIQVDRKNGDYVVGVGPTQQRYEVLSRTDHSLELQRKVDA